MKLPNFLADGYFNSLRASMGASLSSTFKPISFYRPIDLPLLTTLKEIGVDVTFDDIEVLDDSTLAYKGHRVLVYIRDISSYNDRQSLPRFHLAYCRTLEHMRISQRWARYVVANRDDGKFVVNLVSENRTSRVLKLDVCQNCLETLSWQGFSFDLGKGDRASRVKHFSLPEYFEAFPRDLMPFRPEHTSDTAPLNDYPEDWGDISEQRKASLRYRCEQCRRQLSLHLSRYLHVHHRNGQKNDCREENLEVLCIQCHAEEPMHSHLKASPDYAEFTRLMPS